MTLYEIGEAGHGTIWLTGHFSFEPTAFSTLNAVCYSLGSGAIDFTYTVFIF